MIFVLSRSGFHREQTAPVNIFEITVRELVSALRIHSVTFVHAEMPLRVFGETVRADKLVFHIRRRFVLPPPAFAISDQMSFLDKLRRKRDGIFVDLILPPDCARASLLALRQTISPIHATQLSLLTAAFIGASRNVCLTPRNGNSIRLSGP